MTDMKRITVSVTDEIDVAISALREKEEFKKKSYSEIMRYLIRQGLEADRKTA